MSANTSNRHILLVGLGNYSHPNTRHSVGQVVVEALANRFNVDLANDRSVSGWTGTFQVDIPPLKVKGKKKATSPMPDEPTPETVQITLLKPKLLMNISGKAVQAARTRLKPSEIIVLHDSLEHKPFTIASKNGGSANGHNGVRSTIQSLGTDAFKRLRLGIGRGGNDDVATFVLERLSDKELLFWGDSHGPGIDKVWTEIEKIIQQSR
ncbi:hypothetical protein FRC02_009333 [Tulasnella sp. 418]|nr:hypothetical protein FRC02_009333 [Tulasnella sp. 418]